MTVNTSHVRQYINFYSKEEILPTLFHLSSLKFKKSVEFLNFYYPLAKKNEKNKSKR
jgi:hypothetical protein